MEPKKKEGKKLKKASERERIACSHVYAVDEFDCITFKQYQMAK